MPSLDGCALPFSPQAVSGGGLPGGGWGGGGNGVPMSHADIMQAISLLMQLRGGQ